MHRVGVINWSGSEDFAPLMLVMSDREKHRGPKSFENGCAFCFQSLGDAMGHADWVPENRANFPELAARLDSEIDALRGMSKAG